MELTEENYCDQQPVTIEFTFEEHDLLNSILNHAMEAYDFVAYLGIYDLPEDSEIRQRYIMLDNLKNRSYSLWSQRFGN